jgi:hypothetical protein
VSSANRVGKDRGDLPQEADRSMHADIKHSIFEVLEKPFCVWGWDIPDRNLRFIEQIDAEYFEYICRTHVENVDGKDSQHAAMAIRSSYYLALETLFSLLAATLQAPDCIAGWILRATTSDIREITKGLAGNRMRFLVKWQPMPELMGFEDAAKLILQNTKWFNDQEDKTVTNFATLWDRLAHDFLDDHSIKEYNSIKHGFRARAGGFSLRMGIASEAGVPSSVQKMIDVGGSDFGSSFYSAEPIGDDAAARNDPNFVLRRNSVNWFPNNTANRMMLAVISIKNVKSFLQVFCGASPESVQFHRPENPVGFDEPWNESPGVLSSSMDLVVSEAHIQRLTKSEIKNLLKKARSSP